MTKSRLAILAAFVAMLGIAAEAQAQRQCKTECKRAWDGNQYCTTNCN